MNRTRALDWLGWQGGHPVVGVHLRGSSVVVAAVRDAPLRLVGVGHEELPETVLVDGDVREVEAVAAGIARLVAALNLDSASEAVITVEPLVDVLELGDRPGRPGLAACPVRSASHLQAVGVVKASGLRLVRVDAVPVSLARLRPLVGGEPTTVSLGRWEIVTEPHERAVRVGRSPSGPGLCASGPVARPAPVTSLSGLGVPRRLGRVLDLDRHALAIGAALAGCGRHPLVPVRPLEPPDRSAGAPGWARRAGSASDGPKDRSIQ